MAQQTVRPTKKQRELLGFIEQFIAQHGYSPSYREIMRGLNYTSVATVALHVTSLIKRGHLRKRDHSARSLEVVGATVAQPVGSATASASNESSPQEAGGHEAWLANGVAAVFARIEAEPRLLLKHLRELERLLHALVSLGHEQLAAQFTPRLEAVRQEVEE